MFLFRSSAVEGTYSLDPVFFFPLFGINSLTHSPLAAAISLKRINIEVHNIETGYPSIIQ